MSFIDDATLLRKCKRNQILGQLSLWLLMYRYNFCSFRNTCWWGMFGTVCDQAADMVRIEPFSWHYHMDLGFAVNEAALLKHEAIQYSFYFNSVTSQFYWIWCTKLVLNRPNKTKNGPKLAQNSQFSVSNSAKLEWNGSKIKQYLNCFKFQRSRFVNSKT